MQTMWVSAEGAVHTIEMPEAGATLFGEVVWGEFDDLFTAAFWCGQTKQADLLGLFQPAKLGRTLREELAACLLGGFGMRAEVGLAAYHRLCERQLLQGEPSIESLESALAEQFVEAGRTFHYRYPRQKARYLAGCLAQIDDIADIEDDLALRDRLMELPGIGPKTASWIVRNQRSSDRVAIIDIHILNAGRHMALFPEVKDITKHYRMLENRFLKFAAAIDVRASVLDNVIWDYFRRLNYFLRDRPAAESGKGPSNRQHQLALD